MKLERKGQLRSKPPVRREARQMDYVPRPREIAKPASIVGLLNGPPAAVYMEFPKTPRDKTKAIRQSARNEECTVRLEGVCNRDPATTVWSHAPFNAAGKGGALKGLDLLGCYACSACHDVVDGRAPRPPGQTREMVLLDWFYGMTRSIVKLRQKGLA